MPGYALPCCASCRSARPGTFADAEIASARQLHLPFYAKHVLVTLVVEDVPGVERALLLRGRTGTIWLDGSSTAIHAANGDESLRLDASTVPSYVRFFLFVLRGEQGAFTLIESADEITALPDDDDGDDRAARLETVRAQWQALQLGANDADGRFRLDATIAYAGALFGATYASSPTAKSK
jgi:hypothetical protein